MRTTDNKKKSYLCFEGNKKIFEMSYKKYIHRNPEILSGKPIIKGTRISVELIMRKLADGYTVEGLLTAYPHLKKEQIFAALEFAAELIANEEILETA